jgi:hypothetical protein
MSTVRQGLIVAIALSTVAFTSTAMAGKGGVPGANSGAAGQVWNSERSNPSAVPGSALPPGQAWQLQKGTGLSPGQQYKQERELNSLTTPALPPGQTFGTPGNKIPGSLP